MSWNNRIFKHTVNGEEFYALHETFYDDKTGAIVGWTKNPVTEHSESIEDLIQDLEEKLADARRFKDTILNPDGTAEQNTVLAGIGGK